MERMGIIILDMSKKNKLLFEKEKREVINYANLIATGSNVEIIDIDENYEKKLAKLYKNNYPIYKRIDIKKLNIYRLSAEISFDNGDAIVLPYFNNTRYWVKMIVGNKEEFLEYMFENGYFNSFSIICPNSKMIYDIELGEQEYEIRIGNY